MNWTIKQMTHHDGKQMVRALIVLTWDLCEIWLSTHKVSCCWYVVPLVDCWLICLLLYHMLFVLSLDTCPHWVHHLWCLIPTLCIPQNLCIHAFAADQIRFERSKLLWRVGFIFVVTVRFYLCSDHRIPTDKSSRQFGGVWVIRPRFGVDLARQTGRRKR